MAAWKKRLTENKEIRKQKAQANQLRVETLNWLAKTFPEAFDTRHRIRPLKIGIMKDVLDYAQTLENKPFSNSKLRQAVVMFTHRIDYLTAVKLKNPRIDLYGQVVEEITDKQAKNARALIEWQMDKMTLRYQEKEMIKPVLKTSESKVANDGAAASTSIPNVIIKRKFSRSVNSETMNRLKEKLGLRESE